MLRITAMLFFLFASIGCGSDAQDSLKYECFPDHASLPPGSHPEALITPKGYHWTCSDEDTNPIFYADGTYKGVIYDIYEPDPGQMKYPQECLEVKKEWIVDKENRLCMWSNFQPNIYICAHYIYELNIFGQITTLIWSDDEISTYNQYGDQIESTYFRHECHLKEQ